MWTSIDNSLCELGESPFWHPRERALYWLDIPGRAVLRTRGEIGTPSATVERWALSTEPGCMAPARSGGLVIALRDGIYRAREWGGELVAIARVEHDVRTMRFNDGKCDALGRFWSGSINEAKDRANAALYCLDARPGRGVAPTLTLMANQVTTANGLAFSPDARTLYWADTPAHQVRAWDWDAEANTLSQPRVFRQFDAKPEGWTPDSPMLRYAGRPDGATVDAQGHYWVAMFEGAQLLRLAPSGETVAAVPVPAQCPTMPCFGGDDLKTLFVTTTRKGRPAAEIERLPASGTVVSMRVDTPGLPVAFFED
ncbi:SMP-30/gluconolactonase/LRE family protein [Variovorax paradoxus]|jgi:sugar lactone lactonase YvrE|uniref:SMP-30/gluconolactonase/LRE family protein n=1 Tax=Variovorax paradoxus TaxID=34073 RepID=UPI001AE54DFB|nr:SMP-30/gluconolactonase/LRE family protein [Variovorax paradoxus]MDR6453476.1 sugar lactone lactonase YvrE [Variovorax paradoxus]